MSALGQKQTFRSAIAMSALPPHSALHHLQPNPGYRGGCVVGLHLRANFCASAICSGVILSTVSFRNISAKELPCASARLNHMYALT